jgi:hypothetical protein
MKNLEASFTALMEAIGGLICWMGDCVARSVAQRARRHKQR